MKPILGLTLATLIILGTMMIQSVNAQTKSSLYVAYPPQNHQTTASSIFFIGSASPSGEVFINGQSIQRSQAGYFAPSFPLKNGDNLFTIRHKNKQLQFKVIKNSQSVKIPTGLEFAKNSLTPAQDIAVLPNEFICFEAIAAPDAEVFVDLNTKKVALLPQLQTVELPPNSALLTATNQPITTTNNGKYQGCTTIAESGNIGRPQFQLRLGDHTLTEESTGNIEVLSPDRLEVVEVTSEPGVTRTGSSTDYSRLTPLPKGTIATVTGKDGEWLRLDYGAWIKQIETKLVKINVPPRSIIRSVTTRQRHDITEVIFPLQVPVPVSVRQGDRTFTLTLYNTTAQTDTIRFDDDPFVKRLDWQQTTPKQIDYIFTLKTSQQWGYDLKYEGNNLVLTLRHPPSRLLGNKSLSGIRILIDPGHGGKENGSKGPTGYPEKSANLFVSRLLRSELEKRGAMVYLTRESDREVSLEERVKIINKIQPDLALSLHYNALPDGGNPLVAKGISTFWYHPQAHDLAVFLHNYLVEKVDRSSYGVYWNNLALTRPHVAPSVLLELGFMINPAEFEWITNQTEQKKLAISIADGISVWFMSIDT